MHCVIAYLGATLVLFEVKAQSVVATSSTEAEVIAFSVAVKRGQYLRQFCEELTHCPHRVVIYEDNNGVISNYTGRHCNTTLRHIDTAYWHARETVSSPGWEVRKVHTKHQLADFGTKLHDGANFKRLHTAIIEFDPSVDYSKLTAE